MEVDKIICDIIQTDMSLTAGRVMTQNQNWNPPKDSSLYITVKTGNSKIIAVTNKFEATTVKEKKSVVSHIPIDINITSKNREAMERKEEILMALDSTYSRQKQEEYQIKIYRDSNILDLSFVEASSGMNRYRVSCIVSQLKVKEKSIDYYNKFRQEEVVE